MSQQNPQELTILTVPAFQDNYLWIIHNGKHAVVVDPGDAKPILTALHQHHLQLVGILLTHHHADHIGGVTSLLEHTHVPVYGPNNDGIKCITHPLEDNDSVNIAELDVNFKVMLVEGHTLGHIAYYCEEQNWLFCGDTLFGAGCGRLFEGTPQQMHASLIRLANLPAQTEVYCGHEYTLSNLRFALALEPSNRALIHRIESDTEKRRLGIPTIPSQIGIEKDTNPFLRCNSPELIKHLISNGKIKLASDEVTHFSALRTWKNTYV